MIVIHDLAEARTGDVPIFETAKRSQKKEQEQKTMEEFRSILPSKAGEWIYDLWQEFELNKTSEAKIANALDKLEAQVQHNEADLKTWIEWEKRRVFGGLDSASNINKPIMRFKNAVVNEAVKKLMKAGENVNHIRRNAKNA
jgi:putative hydrolase of HD superfamily